MDSKIKYITNRDLLGEIHVSKVSYSAFRTIEQGRFDAIVHSEDGLNDEVIERARKRRAATLSTKEAKVDPDDVPLADLIVRVMTKDHVPEDAAKGIKGKPAKENLAFLRFHPFKHYSPSGDGWVEVGRSHWSGGFEDGSFCVTHGRMSRRLATMFMLLVDRYSRRANWRNYSYLEEMKGTALMHLTNIGLQFDESKSNNPFAFYTTVIKHCFTRVLNLEKRNQKIRDDLLINVGARPSMTRQIEHELDSQFQDRHTADGLEEPRAPTPVPGRPGRRPKSAAPLI